MASLISAHRVKRGFGSFIVVVVAMIDGGARASAPPAPMNCSSSDFGPADGNGYYTIPFSGSSMRFPWQTPQWTGDSEFQPYINNTDYTWQMWFSGNVTSVKLVFQEGTSGYGDPGFETEATYDTFTISGSGGGTSYSGNLDQNNTVEYVTSAKSPAFNYSDDNFVDLNWHSDHSNTGPGWRIKAVKVSCSGRTDQAANQASNVSRLHANGQRDGVLLGTGDIRYFSTVQAADRQLLIHLKPDGPPVASTAHADYDPYVSPTSPTTLPHPGVQGTDYQWKSARGVTNNNMDEDSVLIQPVGYARYVYLAVYAYQLDSTHTGGYRIYDNVIGKDYSMTVMTDFDYRNYQLEGTPCTVDNDCAGACNGGKCLNTSCYCPGSGVNGIYNALSQVAAGLYQATDGTALIRNFYLWNNTYGGTNCGNHACNIVISSDVISSDACSGAAACNFNPDGNGYPQRAFGYRSWPTAWAASAAAHELGHCLYNMPDEYCGAVSCPGGSGYVCGHSLMTGATNSIFDYCTGTSAGCTAGPMYGNGSHGADCFEPGSGTPAANTGNWGDIENCDSDQVEFYFPVGTPKTPDPELWAGSDIWCASNGEHSCSYSSGYISVTTMN